MILSGAQHEKQRGAFQENVSLIIPRSSPVEDTGGETTLLNIARGVILSFSGCSEYIET